MKLTIEIDTTNRNSVRDAYVVIETMYEFQREQIKHLEEQLKQQPKGGEDNASSSNSK